MIFNIQTIDNPSDPYKYQIITISSIYNSNCLINIITTKPISPFFNSKVWISISPDFHAMLYSLNSKSLDNQNWLGFLYYKSLQTIEEAMFVVQNILDEIGAKIIDKDLECYI
jgi:hypothetical protein